MDAQLQRVTALQEQRRKLIKLATHVLRPLIRILLRHGVSAPEFNEIARSVYVDVALNDNFFQLETRSKTFKSRAAILTGLSRKEVMRLAEYRTLDDLNSIPYSNRVARVLDGWSINPQFQNAQGLPAKLPLRDGANSFHALVKKYSGDVPPRAVLDEMVICGAVEIVKRDQVRFLAYQHFNKAGAAPDLDELASLAGHWIEALDHYCHPGTQRPKKLPFEVAELPGISLADAHNMVAEELKKIRQRCSKDGADSKVKVGFYLFDSSV